MAGIAQMTSTARHPAPLVLGADALHKHVRGRRLVPGRESP